MYGGMRVRCERDSGVSMGLVYYSGRPEYHEMGLVSHLLRPGDAFLDIGANAGYYSLLAASRIAPTGSVDAVEPSPPALARLRSHLALNGLSCVRIHELALSDTADTRPFIADRDTENRFATPAESSPSTVLTARLDDLFPDPAFALAKLDVEGAESLVLHGAEKMLARSRPPVWLLEMDKHLHAFNTTEAELAAWLRARGFDLGLYDADTRTFTFGETPWTERPNVVAVARAAREEVERKVKESVQSGLEKA